MCLITYKFLVGMLKGKKTIVERLAQMKGWIMYKCDVRLRTGLTCDKIRSVV